MDPNVDSDASDMFSSNFQTDFLRIALESWRRVGLQSRDVLDDYRKISTFGRDSRCRGSDAEFRTRTIGIGLVKSEKVHVEPASRSLGAIALHESRTFHRRYR